MKILFKIIILLLILVSCKSETKKDSSTLKSNFNLSKDYSELTTKISEIDTIKVWANLSLCTYSGMEKLTITRKGDSIQIQSEFAKSATVDSQFGEPNLKVISIKDTSWKFNEFLKRNEKRIKFDSVRYGPLQVTFNDQKLDFRTTGLGERGRFLSDYCLTMKNLFPASNNYIYGVGLVSKDLRPSKQIKMNKKSTECTKFQFASFGQQADSLIKFMKNALDSTLNENQRWERKFFCAFPNSFAEMDSLFGYHNSKAGALYYSEMVRNGSMFGSMNSIIDYFGNLTSIPDEQFYDKFINICINGYWQADNIRTAFGFGNSILKNPTQTCTALKKRNEKDIKSVFRFIFDSIHPNNKPNQKFYNQLLPVIEKENKRLSELLTESYNRLMTEDHSH